jgi:hypothetical protein
MCDVRRFCVYLFTGILYIMLENTLLNSAIIAVIYLLIKFADMRLFVKDAPPVQDLLKQSLIVWVSGMLGFYVIDQFITVIPKPQTTKAFLDTPDF